MKATEVLGQVGMVYAFSTTKGDIVKGDNILSSIYISNNPILREARQMGIRIRYLDEAFLGDIYFSGRTAVHVTRKMVNANGHVIPNITKLATLARASKANYAFFPVSDGYSPHGIAERVLQELSSGISADVIELDNTRYVMLRF